MGQEIILTLCLKYNKARFSALHIIVFYYYFTKFSFSITVTTFVTLSGKMFDINLKIFSTQEEFKDILKQI